ncbi:hypothetical protein FQN50_001380 [Emmonsiellopsis sp. PD_5]|nr:hypothetical protein FQN50_001380 [Emmonsiellopsis sp. PD_5]
MKSSTLLILIFSAFLHAIRATALPEARPDADNHGSPLNPTYTDEERKVSKELFASLEELSRLVDITYCVGTTGVYKPFRCIGRCHEFEGFELVTTWNTGPLLSDSCGFLTLSHPPNPKRIILGFRGTYSIANTIVDLSAIPQVYTPYPAPNPNPTDPDPDQQPTCTKNCTVHAGFMESWLNARSSLLPHLTRTMAQYYPEYQLVLAGHSLGGAVAALAGVEFAVRGWKPQVTTFGEPRVGNAGFIEYFDRIFRLNGSSSTELDPMSSSSSIVANDSIRGGGGLSYRRVTHVNDPVPLLPLTEWGYRPHAGEIFISKPDVPPEVGDLRYCVGDEDPECSFGAELEDQKKGLDLRALALELAVQQQEQRPDMDGLDEPAIQRSSGQQVVGVTHDEDQLSMQWNPVPHRFRLWELLFAHRDYFWRLGVCLPSVPGWGGGGGDTPSKGKGRWRWRWPWKYGGEELAG